jgi:methylmalonyl-CoA mutase
LHQLPENQKKFSAFRAAELSDWEAAAREELNGANPWEKLGHVHDGLSIKPFYDRNQAAPQILLPVSDNKFLGPRTWFNCPRVVVQNPEKANLQALKCLNQGADGILFQLDDAVNLKALLKGIDWKICSLNFLAEKNQEAIAGSLSGFINEKKINGEMFHGALFCSTEIKNPARAPFRMDGYTIAASTPVKEIIDGFRIISSKKDFSSAAGDVAFSLTLGTDFFMEVARLRSMRVVWNKFLAAAKTKAAPLFIHAMVPAWVEKNYDPHGNMLKGTTAAMAAVLGGCDALTVEPEDPAHPMMSRVALNVSKSQMTAEAWKSIQTFLPAG